MSVRRRRKQGGVVRRWCWCVAVRRWRRRGAMRRWRRRVELGRMVTVYKPGKSPWGKLLRRREGGHRLGTQTRRLNFRRRVCVPSRCPPSLHRSSFPNGDFPGLYIITILPSSTRRRHLRTGTHQHHLRTTPPRLRRLRTDTRRRRRRPRRRTGAHRRGRRLLLLGHLELRRRRRRRCTPASPNTELPLRLIGGGHFPPLPAVAESAAQARVGDALNLSLKLLPELSPLPLHDPPSVFEFVQMNNGW